MTKQSAQRIQAIISLVGVLAAIAVPMYLQGWFDARWKLAAVLGTPTLIFAYWWWRNAAHNRRVRDEMNQRWEARRGVRSRVDSENR